MSDLEPRFSLYVTGDVAVARALIVLQEGFGVNDHVRSLADRYGERGFFVVAPHLYHRHGSPEIDYDDVPAAMSEIAALTREGLTNDLRATTDFLNDRGFSASCIGAVGFCMGGSVAFFAATLGVVGAAVSFYGGGLRTSRMGLAPLVELADELVTPWLGLFGDRDAGIAVDDVEALREATRGLTVATEIVRYPEAQHGFHCDARPDVYDEVATRDADRRTFDFLATHLRDR